MSLLLALVILIGFFARNVTWLFVSLLAVFQRQIRQAFIACVNGCHNGSKKDGIAETMMGRSIGALIGMASVMLANRPARRIRQLCGAGVRGYWQRRDGVDDAPFTDIDEPIHVLWFQKRRRPNPARQGHDVCEPDCAEHRVNRPWCRLRLAVGIGGRQTCKNLIVAPAKVAT